MIWPTGFAGLRLFGGEVAVLDEAGIVVATTDREYRLDAVPYDSLRGRTRRLAEAIGAFAACGVEGAVTLASGDQDGGGSASCPSCGSRQPAMPSPTPASAPTLDPSSVEVGQPTIVLWADDQRAEGQVVVELTNVSLDWVNLYPEGDPKPARVGSGSASFATIRTTDGSLITGIEAGSIIAFNGYPRLLAPGQSGYLVADFDYADVEPTDLVVDTTFVFRRAEPVADRPNPTFARSKVSTVRGNQVEVATSIKPKGARNLTFVGVAYSADGQVLGFVEQWWVENRVGNISLCCLPPTVEPKRVAEIRWVADWALAHYLKLARA